MRVLHVGKYFPPAVGGMENYLHDLLNALHAEGVGCAALVHCERRLPAPDLTGLPYPVVRAPTWGSLAYAPVSPAFPRRLAAQIAAFKPDLLHFHLPNTSAFWALALPSARALPWVLHWHADVVASRLDPRLSLLYRMYRPFERALLARSARVVVTSPDYLASSEALAPWREKSAVLPLGIDPGRVPPPSPRALKAAAAAWPAGSFRLLAVGRLTYYKGFEVLIRACATVTDIACVVVGGGELFTALERQIAQLGLSGRVRLLGHRPDPELHALMQTADALCLPSVERTEAFGLVQLEAMRFGKPMVVSDIPGSGVGWVARECDHALRVPPADVATLAAALRRLIEDPDLRTRLAANSATGLERGFGISASIPALQTLYEAVVREHRPASQPAQPEGPPRA